MPKPEVLKHLRSEMAQPDPWMLETNTYEQSRYKAMLSLIADRSTFHHALEVGCAAGAFTRHIIDRCELLRLLDLLPEAVNRCRRRFGSGPNLAYSVGNVAQCKGWGETYDLIVVSEVLYYLECKTLIKKAVDTMSSWVCPGGLVLFCSVVDRVAYKWGTYGAETAMANWSKHLREERRVRCQGTLDDEQSLIVKYIRNDDNS